MGPLCLAFGKGRFKYRNNTYRACWPPPIFAVGTFDVEVFEPELGPELGPEPGLEHERELELVLVLVLLELVQPAASASVAFVASAECS